MKGKVMLGREIRDLAARTRAADGFATEGAQLEELDRWFFRPEPECICDGGWTVAEIERGDHLIALPLLRDRSGGLGPDEGREAAQRYVIEHRPVLELVGDAKEGM